ncbi:hypothetical protein vseg_014981 [Gypsophila vaccaria]
MARKSNLQKQRELNLRGRSIVRSNDMNEPNGEENRDDAHLICPKPKGPSREANGKSKNIHVLNGIPELEIESDEDVEKIGRAKDLQQLKQSVESQNRVEGKMMENDKVSTAVEMNNLLQLENEDIEEEIEYWKQAVVCFILGANPPWDVIEGFIRRIWTKYNIDKISFLPQGIFLVRFKTMEMKEKVLNSGHYLFDSKPLIFKEWSKDMEMKKTEVLSVLTWVQFHQLPLKFWGKSLPNIMGLVGKYIKSDSVTEQKTKLGYARVMVEVKVDKHLPDQVSFKDEVGQIVKIEVEYEWKPITCGICQKIGHSTNQCRKGQPTQPKVKPPQKIWRHVVKTVMEVQQSEGPEVQVTRTEGKGTPPPPERPDRPEEKDGYSKHSFGAVSYKDILSPGGPVVHGSPSPLTTSYR